MELMPPMSFAQSLDARVPPPCRHFLDFSALSLEEAHRVLGLAAQLKAEPVGARGEELKGQAVAIVMEKHSTRTRASFEIGVAQLGGHPMVLSSQGSQLARGESIEDTARVLSRYCAAMVFRTASHARLEAMAGASRVPVINALSDEGHPVQVLSDLFTVAEALGLLSDLSALRLLRVAFVGDCQSNVARSWIDAARLFRFRLALAAPEGYIPPLTDKSNLVSVHNTPEEAIAGADVVNTDVWVSMGQEQERQERLRAFAGWTVNETLLQGASARAIVLHCLPAHRGEEIDADTLEGSRSRVWDQAENRLHVQKALLLWLLRSGG